jgi:hypothetical protein
MGTQFITDKRGRKVSIILPIRDYEKIMEELEELEDIRAFDKARVSGEEAIPIGQAFKEIEVKRHDL